MAADLGNTPPPLDASPSDGGATPLDARTYNALFEHMMNGIAFCRMLFDGETPTDFIYLYTNSAFHTQTGLGEVVGKRVSEVIPGIPRVDSTLINIYGHVAKTGEARDFEHYVQALGQWFLIHAYSPAPDHFVAIFDVITEKKRIAEDLRKSNEKYRQFVEMTNEGIWAMDATHRNVFVNPALCRMLGHQPHEILGHLVEDFMFEEDLPDHQLRMKSRHAGADGDYEQRFRRKDGSACWCSLTATSLTDENGAFAGSFAILADISERKQAEISLRATSRLLNEAQRIAHIGSWQLDLSTGKLLWSDEIFRLFEIDPQRFGATYEAFLNAIHPEDRDTVDRAYTASLENHTPYEIAHRLLMTDGRVKWVLERGTSEFDASGRPLRSVGTIQDISEQRLAEEALRIAASAFESHEGMVITDAKGIILRVNRAFTAMTGYSIEEMVGQTPRLLKSGRHDRAFYRAMWDSIEHTGGWQGEIWDRRKDGEIFPKWLTISAVKNEAGVVTHYIGTQYDITERKKAEAKINELAFFDQLTGLPNRTLLLDRLKQMMAASGRSGGHGALLFIDLDNFKTLNDTLGHDMGDLLLRQVAERLTPCVREGDTVARLGGDEFVIVLAGLSESADDAANGAEIVAEKILAVLKQSYQLGELTHRSTASIGVTLFRGDQASIDELMKQADLAMYNSKAAGRSVVRFFDPTLESSVKERAALEKDLRRAVDENQFQLHYQAQVMGADKVMGAEALLRWRHPQRGLVPPVEFIPLAEETGLILPLGKWVLETACAQLAAWAGQATLAHLTISVNVSARQLHQGDFVDQVLTVLHASGANPRRLKLELTESLLVENIEEIIDKMATLKAKGVGFSLDDFGTGYSSLAYLKRLPLDDLKIDRSFVMDILNDPNDAAIAKIVVALAQSLGLAVIAEGVETEEQRLFLARHGCHAYQGYLFSRPLPREEFESLLARTQSNSMG